MATVTLIPNATVSLTATLVGAASAHVALSDSGDGSYIEFPATPSTSAKVDLGTFTLPALAQVRLLRSRVRAATVTAPNARWVYLKLSGSTTGSPSDVLGLVSVASTTPAAYSGSGHLTPGGFAPAWNVSQADIDAQTLTIFPQSTGSPIVRIYEAYLDITYNEAPAVVVTAPTGTGTTTGQPLVAWTYTDPEGDLAERYRIKVFSAAQYGAGGFNPETSTPTWDSGEVYSSVTSTPVGSPLLSGTYRAYVKVADAGSGGRYSAWAYSGFVLAIDVPPAPTLTATPNPTLARVTLVVQGDGTGPFTGRRALLERSIDGGATWVDVRGDDVVLDGAYAATVYDYEAPRSISLQYRARITGVHTTSGITMTGPYSSIATVANLASTGWWLKDPLAPARNTQVHVESFPFRQKEPQSVYEPLGRENSVVVGDGVKGIEGALTLWAKTKAEYDALVLILSGARPLWLEDTLGRAWYVKIGASHEFELVRAAPAAGETSPIRHFHRITLPFVEVAAPSSA